MGAVFPHRCSPGTSLAPLQNFVSTAQNRLIGLLPRVDKQRLLALCEPVQLVLSEVLCKPPELMAYVYFPTESFVSLVAMMDGNPGLEVGMVGREGMLGAHLALGVQTAPLQALVQGPGHAWRVASAPFRRELARSLPLQRVLHRYVYVLMGQLALSAGCLRFHLIGPRLARWLLMTQDRAHSEHFHVTHEFLAYMLGVRRVGVTLAARELQSQGLIEYHRGDVTVLDRPGLELASCGCYANDKAAYTAQL
jgi:CRP-like cAMP-binding protein